MNVARPMWKRLESLHAVTYFSEESIAAARDSGLKGFWMGYFGFRAAPMGEPSAATIEAIFGNFAPWMVRRAIPDAWAFADSPSLLDARGAAAASALRRVAPDVESAAVECNELLERTIAAGSTLGRPLFAANAAVELPADPVMRLWQLATTLREHRGDGHVQALAVAGLDGCEAHLLRAAEDGTPPEVLRDNRGWTDDEWTAATERLRSRNLIDGDELTEEGRQLRERVEADTDRLANEPFATALDEHERQRLLGALAPAARSVAESGVVPYPNPIGVDQFD